MNAQQMARFYRRIRIAILVLALFGLPYLAYISHEKNAAIKTGVLLLEDKKYDDAIVEFNKAIAIAPRNYRAYYFRGYAYYLKGDQAQANADYNKSVDLNGHRYDEYKAVNQEALFKLYLK